MNLFFDVDYTILGPNDNLRPHTRTVFEQLVEDGHRIYIWSGVGIRWWDVREHGLGDLVTECYVKPLSDLANRLAEKGIPLVPDFVVDDYPEPPAAFGGVHVTPYYFPRETDTEMQRVFQIVRDVVATGTSTDEKYRAPRQRSPIP